MPTQTLAYASTQVNPAASQIPKLIDLAVTNLPVASVNLYGAGVDGNAGVHNYTYHWTVVFKPAGSAAALSNANAQNPTFGPIDLQGTYLFRLCATSDGAGGASDDNQLTCPTACTIRIATQDAVFDDLQMPADYQRKWGQLLRNYALNLRYTWDVMKEIRLDDLKDMIIVDATLKFQQLVQGGHATFGGNALHLHTGAQIDVATPVSAGHLGVVLVEETALDAGNPVAINAERVAYTALVDGTPTLAGYRVGEISTPKPNVGTTRANALFYVADDNMTLKDIAFALMDSGSVAGPDYNFAIFRGVEADWAAGTPTDTGVFMTAVTATDGAPLVYHKAVNFPLTKGWYIGVVCTTFPTTPGNGLTVTLTAHRNV